MGTGGSQETEDNYIGLLSVLLTRVIAESPLFTDFALLMVGRDWSKADAHEWRLSAINRRSCEK